MKRLFFSGNFENGVTSMKKYFPRIFLGVLFIFTLQAGYASADYINFDFQWGPFLKRGDFLIASL